MPLKIKGVTYAAGRLLMTNYQVICHTYDMIESNRFIIGRMLGLDMFDKEG
jgi:hypothetical protein